MNEPAPNQHFKLAFMHVELLRMGIDGGMEFGIEQFAQLANFLLGLASTTTR